MKSFSSRIQRRAARARRLAPLDGGLSDGGFSVVEMMMALAIFTIIATVFASQLVGNYRTFALTNDRSVAEDLANETIEMGRNLNYFSLGTTPGNPPGVIPRTATKTVEGVSFDVTTTVKYVDDPVPGGYHTAANYKRLEVEVAREGVVVANMATIVAPPVKAAINRATVKVLASDYANNTPIPNAVIGLSGGPSPARSDFTDAAGNVVFAELLPTNVTNPTYTITASAPGYSVLPNDVAPAPAAQTSLLVSQIYSTSIRLFKTVTATVNLVKPDGTPFMYPSTLSVSSARGATSMAVSNGTLTFTTVGSEPVIPSVTYTMTASSSIAGVPVAGNTVTKTVPNQYPSDLTSTFTVVMPLPPPTPVTVTVVKPGNIAASGIPVLITGGDDNVTQTGTTASNGKVTVSLPPSVSAYTVTLPTQNQTNTISVAGTAVGTSFTLVVPSVKFVFRDATGAPVPFVLFTVSGGDDNVVRPGLANASGEFAISLMQTTTPYTLTVFNSPQSSQKFLVSGAGDYLVFMTSEIRVELKAAGGGGVLQGMLVQITGGDLNATLSGVTDSNGRLEINVAPSIAPYTLTIPAQQGYAGTTQSITVDGTSQTFNLDLVHT